MLALAGITSRGTIVIALTGVVLLALATPAGAIDLNGYHARQGKPPLVLSGDLAASAHYHACAMARRGPLDHKGWRQRVSGSTTAAENVSYGCDSEDCAIRQWARSLHHRRNMLMSGVSRYGIASAVDARGAALMDAGTGN